MKKLPVEAAFEAQLILQPAVHRAALTLRDPDNFETLWNAHTDCNLPSGSLSLGSMFFNDSIRKEKGNAYLKEKSD